MIITESELHIRNVKIRGRSHILFSTLNLFENFCPEFENIGENFGEISCKMP